MPEPRIVLAGIGAKVSGLTWETNKALRIGRQTNLDVVLRDHSVDRIHAEVRHHGLRWVLRDLTNSTFYPTLVNDVALSGKDQTLKADDIIQIGKLRLRVSDLVVDEGPAPQRTPIIPCRMDGNGETRLMASGIQMLVKAKMHQTWDKALEAVTLDTSARPRQDNAMLALVRANHHLTHISHLDELLRSILADTIGALNAQRGSIILADPQTEALALKASLAPSLRSSSTIRPFSKTLVRRCFDKGESLLCDDVNADESLAVSRSIRYGAMASVICALLRTPHKRIGVLHLDRGFLDDPFSENDLYYADALAASVAVGIEMAHQVEQQRGQFLAAVTMMARTVETRDQYAGDHTSRLTDYSVMLAEELKLSAAEKYNIQFGTPLHDIGKIGIDDAILRKPGKLSDGEFEHMKTHTTKGAMMLDTMKDLHAMIPIVRHHHERWDGTGYPDRLAQEQIPLAARIVSIADAFEAMTSDRPYRAAMPAEQAFLELIGKAGTHFDPNAVYAFLRMRQKIEERMKQSG